MDRTSDIPMGRPREGPPVSHKVYVAYLKKEKEQLKRERKEPKVIGPRNFCEEQIRKDAEAKATGSFRRDVFKPGTLVCVDCAAQGGISCVAGRPRSQLPDLSVLAEKRYQTLHAGY